MNAVLIATLALLGKEIVLQPNNLSLTNEMMKVFKENTFEAMG